MIKYIGQAARAIYAGVAMFLGSTAAALTNGQSFSDLDTKTWLIIGGSTIASFAGVYGITNSKPS